MPTNTITLDEINLLKNSEEIKDINLYGNLYEIISTNDFNKGLQISSIKGLNDKAKNALYYNKALMMKNAVSEWYAEKVIETDNQKKIRCGLCNTRNKYLFFIRNRKNNTVLNVGSSCITKFPGMEGYQEQKNALNSIQKNRLVAQRVLEFNNRFPNALQYIRDKETQFSNLPVLIPKDKYELITQLIIDLRNIYTDFTQNGKCKKYSNPFDIFQIKMTALDNSMNYAENYAIQHKDDKYICRRGEINWLINTNRTSLLLKIAENNGFYTREMIKPITSPQFIKDKFIMFSSRNNSSFLQMKKYIEDQNELLFVTKQRYNPPIYLSMNTKSFMSNIGSNCIFDVQYIYTTQDIIKYCTIIPTQENIFSIILSTNPFVEKYGCIFLDDQFRDYFYLYRRKDSSVRIINKQKFLQAFTPYSCRSLDSLEKYFKSFVYSKSAKWIDKEQQNKNDIYTSVQKLYKEYKKSE